MSIELPSNSRFKLTEPVLTADGKETFGLMTQFKFQSTDNYITISVPSTLAHRPDLIAERYYGSPSFYWVPILFNKVRNPFQWPKIGEVIRLPVNSVVIPEL